MRTGSRLLLAASVAAAAACSDSAGTAIEAGQDFFGTVEKVEFESANGPAGPYAQYDLWIAIPPSSQANAGVVLPKTAPVFISRPGGLVPANGDAIRAGDRVHVWRDPVRVAWGAVQGPPGAPTYTGTQLVIER